MFMHKSARITAVFAVFVATVFASGRAALAVNVPDPGGVESPPPLPPMDPTVAVASGPNWTMLVAAVIALVIVAALVALYRSGARPRAARHA